MRITFYTSNPSEPNIKRYTQHRKHLIRYNCDSDLLFFSIVRDEIWTEEISLNCSNTETSQKWWHCHEWLPLSILSAWGHFENDQDQPRVWPPLATHIDDGLTAPHWVMWDVLPLLDNCLAKILYSLRWVRSTFHSSTLLSFRGCCHRLAIPGWDREEPHRAVCAEPWTKLPESCRMNSWPETSTPCSGQPFHLICQQLSVSGASWNVWFVSSWACLGRAEMSDLSPAERVWDELKCLVCHQLSVSGTSWNVWFVTSWACLGRVEMSAATATTAHCIESSSRSRRGEGEGEVGMDWKDGGALGAGGGRGGPEGVLTEMPLKHVPLSWQALRFQVVAFLCFCVYVFSFARDLHVPLSTVIICANYSAHRKSLPHRIALPVCTNLTILLKQEAKARARVYVCVCVC